MANRISDEIKDKVEELSKTGMSKRRIADECKISVGSVTRIQNERDIDVPSREKGGRVSRKVDLSEINLEKEEDEEPKFTILKQKTIELVGVRTNYTYEVALHGKDLRIKTGYSEDIVIDLKDAAGFAEEIAEVVRTVLKMRQNVWEP